MRALLMKIKTGAQHLQRGFRDASWKPPDSACSPARTVSAIGFITSINEQCPPRKCEAAFKRP
jgi:hypothetical protein